MDYAVSVRPERRAVSSEAQGDRVQGRQHKPEKYGTVRECLPYRRRAGPETCQDGTRSARGRAVLLRAMAAGQNRKASEPYRRRRLAETRQRRELHRIRRMPPVAGLPGLRTAEEMQEEGKAEEEGG